MAAWLGEDAPVQALFDAAPEIEYAIAWDAEAQRERRARPRSILRDGLTRLTTGMGLWLLVGGDDGVLAAEAFARFGGNLVAASRWNAETQRHERYRPGAPGEANTLRALRPGDAIEVELTSDARWWQPGGAPTPVTFAGADAIEGYPVDPESPSYRFMGRRPMFLAAGFEDLGPAGKRRHAMRRWLREPPAADARA